MNPSVFVEGTINFVDFFITMSNIAATCFAFELFTKKLIQEVIRSFPLKLKICLTNEEIGKSLSSILIKDTNPLDTEFYVTFIKPANEECTKRWSDFYFQRSTIYLFF